MNFNVLNFDIKLAIIHWQYLYSKSAVGKMAI